MDGTLQLSTKTLEWAANKSGRSLSEFARSLYAREKVADSISRGEMTLAQIRKFADQARVPFGFLFLASPPEKFTTASNLVDFRTIKNNEPLSDNFLDIYKDIEHKQSWYREYLQSIDAPAIEFVGRYRDNFEVETSIVAKDIRRTLNLDNLEWQIRTAEDYFNALSLRCEQAGILVFKNSVVVNTNTRKLDSEEFRGFVISDPYAPAIFINGEDTKYANIFTLAHELAHVWMGESGISDADTNSNNAHEIKCNAIAAEVLVPKDAFLAKWDETQDVPRQKITILNNFFKVSELVIARVALTNNKISRHDYNEIQVEVVRKWREYKAKQSAGDGGPAFATMVPIKNSRRVTRTVLDLLRSNQMTPSEASILLNISATKVVAL